MAMDTMVYLGLVDKMAKHYQDVLYTSVAAGAFHNFCCLHIDMLTTDIATLSVDDEDFKDKYRELQCGLKLWQELRDFSVIAKSKLEEQKDA